MKIKIQLAWFHFVHLIFLQLIVTHSLEQRYGQSLQNVRISRWNLVSINYERVEKQCLKMGGKNFSKLKVPKWKYYRVHIQKCITSSYNVLLINSVIHCSLQLVLINSLILLTDNSRRCLGQIFKHCCKNIDCDLKEKKTP